MSIELNTSVDDLKSSVDCGLKNNYLTVANFDEALAAEASGSNRKSVLSFLKSRRKTIAGPLTPPAKKPAKKNAVIIPQVITSQTLSVEDWEPGRQMLAAVHTHGRLFLLAQALLGWWLHDKKKELGFQGSGRRKKESGQVGHFNSRTWDEWVEEELQIPRRTADRFIAVHLGAKAKLKKLKTKGGSKALALISSAPGEISPADLQTLQDELASVTDGETQKSLLEELKLVKAPQGSGVEGGRKESDKDKRKPTMGEFAEIFFGHFCDELIQTREHSDYKKALHALPLIADDDEKPDLTKLERRLTAQLKDVEAAKKKALKDSQKPKPRK